MRSTPADGPAAPIIRLYYDSLDGLRALAFLAVFGWHCVRMVSSSRVFDWGWTGVDLFFVLSGFLITGILFDSLGRGFYFRNFYARRTLRIFPLFYSVWFALLLLTPILQVHWNRYNVLEAIYLGNFFTPAGVLGKHPLPGSLSYGLPWRPGYRGALLVDHFWSLCVEEQYYLVWPAVIYFVRARGRLLAICALGILGSPLLRVAIVHFAPAQLEAYGLYYPTYVRCDGLLSGSALALVLRSPSALSISRLRQAAWCCAAVAVAVMVLVIYCRGGIGHVPIVDPFVCTFGYSLIALMACSILLLSILPSSGLAGLLRIRPMVALGRLSYGMYINHEILLVPLDPLRTRMLRHHVGLVYPVLLFGLSFFLARLTFRFIESPFLRLKSRWSERPYTVSDPPPDEAVA